MQKLWKKDGTPTKAALRLSESIVDATTLAMLENGDKTTPTVKLHLVSYYGRGRHTTPARGKKQITLFERRLSL